MKKEIFLDFTSLLDVTLIVIFFFVLFSRLDYQEQVDKLEAAEQVAIENTQIAEERKKELEQEKIDLENEYNDKNENLQKHFLEKEQGLLEEIEKAKNAIAEKETELDELRSQLQNDLSIVRESNERQAADTSEILNYSKGGNLKIILDIKNGSEWSARITKSGEYIDTISSSDDVFETLEKVFEKTDYAYDDTIFCDFIFNSTLAGSNKAVRLIKRGLNYMGESYKHLYVSDTDLSIGE